MTEPLLLAARELARGSVASLPKDVEVVASAASAAHLAVIFRSRTERNRVCLGVLKSDEGDAEQEPQLVDLLPQGGDFDTSKTEDSKWTLTWSPDRKFLVVSGRIPGSEGDSEGVLWLFARPEWLAYPGASTAEATSPSLLLQVAPSKYLTEKHWNPATGIMNVFFPTQSGSKMFLLGDDGVWLSVEVQLAKLALLAMDQTAMEDTAGIFMVKVVKKLTEWHAGVTAACYEPQSATLVVTGGVRDPSDDLVTKHASSLSVWKVKSNKDSKEVAELLDFTMVLKGEKKKRGDDTLDETEQSDLVSTVAEDTGELLTSVLAPLKILVGAGTQETQVMRGSIRHLALAPNGNFVAMVDDLGRIAIRQIDACADVLKWQKIEDVSTGVPTSAQSIFLKQVEWLTSDLIALIHSSVIYARFIPHSDEGAVSGPISSDSDNESLSPSGSSGRLVLTPAKYYRPSMNGQSGVQILAVAAKEPPSDDKHITAFTACEIIFTGNVWLANKVQSLAVEQFINLLMDAHKFEDALATVALYEMRDDGIGADEIHRRIWTQYREQATRMHGSNEVPVTNDQELVFLSTRPRELLRRGERDEFADALDHLRAMSDKQWVLGECLQLVADDSSANMKKVLDLAMDAWVKLNDGDEVATELSQEKVDLQRYRYRLETLRLILCQEEAFSITSVAGDQLFDGMAYVLFRCSPVVRTAKQFAREGRVEALTVLFCRHAWNLLPHWLEILELLPPCVSPLTYAQLLPAVAAQVEDNGQLFTLRVLDNVAAGASDDNETATPVTFLPENQVPGLGQDLTAEEMADFKELSQASREERNARYGEWFRKRILELDTRYGQLAFAYELSSLAIKCLSGWSSQEAKKPLEDFFLQSERLFKCVYPLHLSACCLLPLNEWSALSMQEQAIIVVGSDEKELTGDVSPIMDRLDAVFVSQRRDRTYSLDDLFSWLAQTISSKSSLSSLTLAAQLINRSNPSMGRTNRWIQSDTRLIETALDVVYSVNASDIIGNKALSVNEDVYIQRHLALVEQLWTIFQSLPVRKENDPPEIAQLQVAVDEMEDLMVTMDVLSRYGVVSSPSGLKYRMLASSDVVGGGGTSVCLLEQMCEFALPGEYSDDEDNGDGSQCLEVLQDALKLKEHAFGERLTQEMILDVILKHLLAPDRAYVDAAQNLVNHWIASDVEAVDHVLDELLMAIRAKLDSVIGYSEEAKSNAAHAAALSCIGIVRQLLSLPLWDEGERAASRAKQQYQDMLVLETDKAHACELLDLLTYGAVKLSPSNLRSSQEDGEEEKNARLDAVCQVFVSNPSNYKPSVRAREWLAQHPSGKSTEGETTTDVWDKPLAAVMHLAKLLRVDSQKLEIRMKGAYAALYCMDYDVAYELTMQVIDEIPADADAVAASGSWVKLTLLHLVSLVLDLVSASSFGSWGKKRKLCCALFSAATASSLDLFAHQVTDLVLSWLERIEAIQALMVELGLSEDDLEQRRLSGGKHSASGAEAVLLSELKVVVDLLHEEKNDRQFLLRLLQRGFQLTQVMSTGDSAGIEINGNAESLSTHLQQMAQLCVKEAVKLIAVPTVNACGDWQQFMELSFSYLIQWSDLCADDEVFEAFCIDDIFSSVFTEQPDSSTVLPSNELVHPSEIVGRHLHHFLMLQVAQANNEITSSGMEALQTRRKRFEVLSASYEAARRAVSSLIDSQNESMEDVANSADELMEPRLLMSEQRYQIFLNLAQRCQERLASQKKSQELEQMSSFFNTDLDLELFSTDESYRNERIWLLATKKEHLLVSMQFASKYGIDEYECVLVYLRYALLFPPDSSRIGRRDQLDQAFHVEQVDILEKALQRPVTFGDLLLGNGPTGEPSLYEELDGTDHVGILLVLRMILECSKRISQECAELASPHERSLFPLSKPSTDRITLLFMCLKKLKDIGDSMDDVDSVDLKLIGAASTTTELLTAVASSRIEPQVTIANRQAAVQAARPLLSSKTIKFVTKILRKLHRVTASSMVMIYINDLLTGIWGEHGDTGSSSTGALSADLAAYAYESCVPCLSVLSNEHLMLFHYLFLDGSSGKPAPELVMHLNVAEEFYGQPLSGLQHFGALLTSQKRVVLVADTLTLFQTKYNSWQNAGPRSNVSSESSTSSSSSTSWDPSQHKRKEQELQYLEREMAENTCCWLLGEIEANGLMFNAKDNTAQSLEPVVSGLRKWFAMDLLQQAANEKEVLHRSVLMNLCERVTSLDLATLIMELVLRAGGSNTNREAARNAIAQSYQIAVANLVNRCMGSDDGGAKPSTPWVERLAWTWVTGSTAPNSTQMAKLGDYLRAALSGQHDEKPRAIHQRVVTLLTQVSSTLLKEIGLNRLEEMQTPADETEAMNASVVVGVREAVLSQWMQLIALKEEQQKWTEAAILSHVLVTHGKTSLDTDAAKWDFGLYVKSIWSALLVKHKMDESADAPPVLAVGSYDISDHFTAIFEKLLVFLEVCSNDENPKSLRFAEVTTVVLSNLLLRYDDIRAISVRTAERSAAAWQDEQQRAVQARIRTQFQLTTTTEKQALPQSTEDASSWSALFARGVWGARLLSWYTTHAYAELRGEEEATEAVILVHWEANNVELALQLLLMCPFDSLREKYVDRALSVVRQLPQASSSWATVMELALLRFDVAVLLQHGLHSAIVAFLLQSSAPPALWTSSGDYVVCALVTQGEFAAAGRLTCALRHAHPLLWDVENARLLLANYLRSLASSPVKSHDSKLTHLKHQVHVQTSKAFASAIM